jgi:hypothetical protein
VPNFAKAHTAFQIVKSFFHMHNISEHDENIVNMEKAKQINFCWGGEKSDFHRDIQITVFFPFTTFVDLSARK